MENDEKMMTGEESLRIITEMLNRTRVNFCLGSFHLLFWGWLILFCSLSDYLMVRFTSVTHHYYVWFLVIPGVFVSMIYGYVSGRKMKVHTYADSVWMWTWMAYILTMIVLFIIHSRSMETVAQYILMLTGFPTFVSGIILRFKPLIVGGIIFWIMTLVVSYGGPAIGPLGVPAAMIFGYLVPGYMLKNKVDNDTI